MSTMDSRKEDQQRQLAESLAKPAQMFDELKSQWESMMASQTENMKSLVDKTVNEALMRRSQNDDINRGPA